MREIMLHVINVFFAWLVSAVVSYVVVLLFNISYTEALTIVTMMISFVFLIVFVHGNLVHIILNILLWIVLFIGIPYIISHAYIIIGYNWSFCQVFLFIPYGFIGIITLYILISCMRKKDD